MNTEDLRSLAGRAETIEGREADRLTAVHRRIRTARRRRAGAASACVGGSVLALVLGVSALTGPRDGRGEPMEPLTPSPTPTATVTATDSTELPDGQETYLADIRPGDIQGWETAGSLTNTQAGFLGDTELSMTLTYRADQRGITPFCRGDSDTWYLLSYGDGRQWGPCSPVDSFPVVPEFLPIGPYTTAYGSETARFRMIVTKPTQKWLDCLSEGRRDCGAILPPARRLVSTDAQFGFVVYQHRPAPTVLEVLGKSLEAMVTMADGKQYLVDKAVLAASDASTLVVHLDHPDRASIVGIYTIATPELDLCRERHDTEGMLEEAWRYDATAVAKLDRRCLPQLELRLNRGQPLTFAGLFGDFGWQATKVPADTADEVTVDVVKNDPRNIRFAVVIWEARS